MRVVIADDSVLLREGLARLLVEAGIDVVDSLVDGPALEAAVAMHQPDLAIIDIRMPPSFTHEGAETATRLRAAWPRLGILLLSQSIESRFALELARTHPTGFGYLLKDRVVDVGTITDAIERITSGGTVLDPDIVAHFLSRQVTRSRLAELTGRERDVLALMAEGRSNRAIARQLVVSEKTLESHIASIFSKLDLLPEPQDHRRVLAVRAWMSDQGEHGVQAAGRP
ncbi:MAG TPA: response regulator transcription factor [Thermomicrobiales bacterium]|nr:response regulator transcription factor [Thermomicrobiales bacterium]